MQATVLFMLAILLAVMVYLGLTWLVCFVAAGLFHTTLPFWPVFAAVFLFGVIVQAVRGK